MTSLAVAAYGHQARCPLHRAEAVAALLERECDERVVDLLAENGRLRSECAQRDAEIERLCAERNASHERIVQLEREGRTLLSAGRAYMKYHTEKFYSGVSQVKPTGLTPALDNFEKILNGEPSE
jgi:hypothetical protein